MQNFIRKEREADYGGKGWPTVLEQNATDISNPAGKAEPKAL